MPTGSTLEAPTPPVSAASIRPTVQAILRDYGFHNRFKIRTVSFEGFGYGRRHFVRIFDWNPNPISEQLASIIRERTHAIAEFRRGSD